MVFMLEFGDLGYSTIYHKDHYIRLTPITKAHLDDLSKWPKFKTFDMQWANFFPSNIVQKNRWFRENTRGNRLWFVGERTEDNWRTAEVICRVSLITPIHGSDFIFGIVIHPELLERGLGTKFTEMILRAIFEMTDAEGVWLETHHTNKRAQHVYEKVGFERLGYSYHKGFTSDHDMFLNYHIPRSEMEKKAGVVIVLGEAKV